MVFQHNIYVIFKIIYFLRVKNQYITYFCQNIKNQTLREPYSFFIHYRPRACLSEKFGPAAPRARRQLLLFFNMLVSKWGNSWFLKPADCAGLKEKKYRLVWKRLLEHVHLERAYWQNVLAVWSGAKHRSRQRRKRKFAFAAKRLSSVKGYKRMNWQGLGG